jgi:hypothetical protein
MRLAATRATGPRMPNARLVDAMSPRIRRPIGAGRGLGVAYSAELKVCPMARADDWDLGSGVGSTEAVRQRGGVVDVDRSDSA